MAIALGDLNNKTSITGSEKIPVSGSGNPSLTPALLNFSLVNQQTDSYTLVLTDAFKKVEISKATAVNLTVPLNSSVAFPVGTVIVLKRTGVGLMTVVATGGVTITGSSGGLTDAGLNVEMTLRKTGTDTWDLQNGSPVTYSDWVPTFGGFSAAPTITSARYTLIGKMCNVYLKRNAAGTSNATTFTITLPFNAKNIQHFWGHGVDNSGTLVAPIFLATRAGSNILDLYKDGQGAAWTASGGKAAHFSFTYEIE